MTKQDFKKQILTWLDEKGVDYSKTRPRVFNTRRYGYEVRFYGQSTEITNSRSSLRRLKETRQDENGNNYNALSGVFTRKISNYIYINEGMFENEEEREFFLTNFKFL